MTKEAGSLEDLVHAFNTAVKELHDLRAELLAYRLMLMHMSATTIKRAQDPQKYFEGFKDSSRQNVEGAVFGSGNETLNEEIRRTALAKQEALFDEIGRALGLRVD